MRLSPLRFEDSDSGPIHMTDFVPHQKLKILSYEFVELLKVKSILGGCLHDAIKKLFELFNLLGPDLAINH